MLLWFNSIIPRILGVEAITLYPFIFFRNDYDMSYHQDTLGHELIHAAQIKAYGVFSFYWLYLKDYLTNGRSYSDIKFERDAYQGEHEVAMHIPYEYCKKWKWVKL